MLKFSFVILHYNTYEETLNCINYIKQLDNQKLIEIIIVNNCSTDDSIKKIKKIYSSNEINILDSEYNTGFAKGNNLGFSVAKHALNSDYIVCMNSDVYIKQKNFLNLIDEEYKKSHFDLLGPAIYTLDGDNQNPVGYIHDTLEKINKTLILNKLRFLKSFFPKIKKQRTAVEKNSTTNNYQLNVPLHGACIIASSKFINNHEYLFYPDTFLYGEEDLMYYLSKINNETLVYSSSLEVIHAEDASTNSMFGRRNRSKKQFVLRNSTESLKILKKIMKNS